VILFKNKKGVFLFLKTATNCNRFCILQNIFNKSKSARFSTKTYEVLAQLIMASYRASTVLPD